jgi:hypothetical protein
MDIRRLTYSPFEALIEESLLSEILEHVNPGEHEEALELIVAIVGLGILTVCLQNIPSPQARAVFVANMPQLLQAQLSFADFAKYDATLPQVVKEHVERTLLSLRTRLK